MTDEVREPLVDKGYLKALSDQGGLYATGHEFESLVDELEYRITSWGRSLGAELLHFPPVMERALLEKAGYFSSFPHLIGAIQCLPVDKVDETSLVPGGSEQVIWDSLSAPSNLVLAPAACYPVYAIAAEKPLPRDGRYFGASACCFRREPSVIPTRLQSFRMQEIVFLGAPRDVAAFRREAMAFAEGIAGDFGLQYRMEVATDPFFGPGARFKSFQQRDQQDKFEMLIPVVPESDWTACMSFNYHHDHFAAAFGLEISGGGTAHSACFAVGLERLALAIIVAHDTHSVPEIIGNVRRKRDKDDLDGIS